MQPIMHTEIISTWSNRRIFLDTYTSKKIKEHVVVMLRWKTTSLVVPWPSLLDQRNLEIASIQKHFAKSIHSILRMSMHRRHGYETDTLGALGIFVVQYLGSRHFAALAENKFQLGAIHRERQITQIGRASCRERVSFVV